MRDIALMSPRYLWAADSQAAWIPTDKLVENRYHVVESQLWLDTQPKQSPVVLTPIPSKVLPYFHLYPYRLHLPQVYGFCILERADHAVEIPLLDHIPVDNQGKLFPTLAEAWTTAKPVRQLYWLWQIVNLWRPFMGVGVIKSLLVMDNLRVDGWRLCLRELYLDDKVEINYSSIPKVVPAIAKLGEIWHDLLLLADPTIAQTLFPLTQKMQEQQVSIAEIGRVLNSCLLQQAAKLPLHWQICGGTDIGVTHDHNEDSYYPTMFDIKQNPLATRVGIICDGIGGHEGGEVASQLAVQSLRLQVETLLKEIVSETEIISPEQIIEHLIATIRVVNNVIVSRNREQRREHRRRMGTTLVMAIQLPQQIRTEEGVGNSHELYIAHVGDSRAYWITGESCQQLTVDDDVTTRQVKLGRNLWWESVARNDSGALTQALGMREGESLKPTVQRFILEEDGILLLCSDGLSDRDLVEKSWHNYGSQVLLGQMSLPSAVESWLNLAHRQNGHDNITIVMMSVKVSSAEDDHSMGQSFHDPVTEINQERETLNLNFLTSSLGDSTKNLIQRKSINHHLPNLLFLTTFIMLILLGMSTFYPKFTQPITDRLFWSSPSPFSSPK